MGQKIVLQNLGSNAGSIAYQNLNDLSWVRQSSINPGQTKTIWCVDNTLTIFNPIGSNIVANAPAPPSVAPEKKSTIIISQEDDINDNWFYTVFNSDDATTIGPIDLGLDSNFQFDCCPSINATQDSGYMVLLYNSKDSILSNTFIDYKGNIIESYTGLTENYDYYLNGDVMTFNDYNNGILKYSDGKTVKTISYDSESDFVDVDYNYDINYNSGFLIYSGSEYYSSYNLVTMDSIKPLVNYDNYNTGVQSLLYNNLNVIPLISYNDNTGTYSILNIYDTNGGILQQIDLRKDNDYTNFNFIPFGTNKFTIVFYNSGNDNIPWLIYTYNSTTNTLISTTHDRSQYTSFASFNDYFDGFSKKDFSENLHMIFYNYVDNSYDTTTADYLDILSYFDGDTDYRDPYVLANNNYLWVSLYSSFNSTSSFSMLIENGSFVGILNISKTAQTISNVSLIPDVTIFESYEFGNYFAIPIFTDYSSNGSLFVFDKNGIQSDSRPFVEQNFIRSNYNTLVVSDSTGTWYFDLKTESFKGLNTKYEQCKLPDICFSSKNINSGNIIIYNFKDDNVARLLTPNGVTNEFTLPFNPEAESEREIVVNNSYILFSTNETGVYVITLYDLSFNKLQTITTTESKSPYKPVICENRLIFSVSDGSKYTDFYLINANNYKKVTLKNTYDAFRPNDKTIYFD